MFLTGPFGVVGVVQKHSHFGLYNQNLKFSAKVARHVPRIIKNDTIAYEHLGIWFQACFIMTFILFTEPQDLFSGVRGKPAQSFGRRKHTTL